MKIGCLLSLFEKKNRIENVKMLLQNNTSNESLRHSKVLNKHPENHHSYGRKSLVSKSKFSKRKKQKVIFGDNIPRDIGLREFNYLLHNVYVQLN